MPKLTRTNAKGLYQQSGKGAGGVPFVESAVLALPADGLRWRTASDAGVVQPAGSIITKVTVVCSTAVDGDGSAGTAGLRIGTAAGGAQVMALDADSIMASANDLAAGKGTSSDAALATSLGGPAALVVVADTAYSAAERTLFPEAVRSANAAIAGEFSVFIEFLMV